MNSQIHHRDRSLDATRGLIMALMALDHCRMYFTSARFDPVDLDATNLGYFLTRWVTHLCAPGFFFLAGLSAALAERQQSSREATYWLVSRGLWLVALELTVIGLSWSFTLGWSWFGVIWSLGGCMVVLGLLRYLPKLMLAALGFAYFLLAALAGPGAMAFGGDTVTAMVFTGGIAVTPLGSKIVLFPIIPWLSVMAVGYGTSMWLTCEGRVVSGRLARAGGAGIALFVALWAAGFGDPLYADAGTWPDLPHRIMAFLAIDKYPPSLQFVLVTLSILLLFTAMASRAVGVAGRLVGWLLPFGRTPLFFYLLHLYLIHGLALATAAALGWPTDYLFWTGVGPNLKPPEGYGFALAGVYTMWAAILIILYPLCAAYAAAKARSDRMWMKYL